MVFLRPVIVRSKEDSNAIALDRYDYMRSSGIDAQPRDNTVLVKELGAPVLPPLTNGQPPPGGAMAAAAAETAGGAGAGASGHAVPPAPAASQPPTEPAPLYRPVQK